MKDAGGQWHGLTVDLWKDLAADLDYRYRFVESGPDAILDQINQGTLDTAAGPYAATVEREREVDFSHAYALSGIGIAILRARDEDRWLAVVEALSTPTALRLYTGIVCWCSWRAPRCGFSSGGATRCSPDARSRESGPGSGGRE